MSRVLLVIVILLLLTAGVGGVLLGAFPPNPRVQTVEKILPNDRFKSD